MLDIVSDLLCSIPDEKLSGEHSLSMGLLLASFTCGTDKAVMAVAEGKKQNDSERVESVETIYNFILLASSFGFSYRRAPTYPFVAFTKIGLGLGLPAALGMPYHIFIITLVFCLFFFSFFFSGKFPYYCSALSVR